MDPGAPDVAWNESWQGALDDAVEELRSLRKPVRPKDVLDLMKLARCPADENIPKLYAVCSKLEYWTRERRDAMQKEGDPASLSARLRAWSVGGPSREEADAALDQMVEGCREARRIRDEAARELEAAQAEVARALGCPWNEA